MLSAFLLIALSSTPSADQAVPINPSSWFSADDYPPEAVMNNAEGTVEYEVRIDPDGRPTSCRITASSGSNELDQATCTVVMTNARFQAPRGSDKDAADAKFRSKVSWRASKADPSTFRASIIDLTDARHPTCTMQTSGEMPVGPFECSELLKQQNVLQELGKRYVSVTFLVATSPAPLMPFQGVPAWGERLSYMASEQYYLSPSFPAACVGVAAEGWNAGRDPCAGFVGMRTISEEAKRSAKKRRLETSVLAVRR